MVEGAGLSVNEDKAITLGHPSYVWGFGQERRLDLIRRFVPLEDRRILDIGCGLGMYVRAFHRFSSDVHGVDIDDERAVQAGKELSNICLAPAEALPYRSGTFDVVLSHEVIEHVDDDRLAVAEAMRVLREPQTGVNGAVQPGGRLVIFAPNRLYPFETHGVYWRGEYYFGNIPLVNYLPGGLRAHLCPHVRAYTSAGIRQLLVGLPVKVLVHSQVFPGYDKIVRRQPTAGRALRALTYRLEKSPLRRFGLSHFLVVEKTAGNAPQTFCPQNTSML